MSVNTVCNILNLLNVVGFILSILILNEMKPRYIYYVTPYELKKDNVQKSHCTFRLLHPTCKSSTLYRLLRIMMCKS